MLNLVVSRQKVRVLDDLLAYLGFWFEVGWGHHLDACYPDLVKQRLHVKYKYVELISKLFHCFISDVTMSETEIKLFQSLKLFQNYFSDIEPVGRYS